MELTFEDQGELMLARVTGDLGRTPLTEQRDQIISALSRHERPALLLDVSGTANVDSLGLGFLAAVHRHVSSRGGAFGLTGLTDELRLLLKKTGLSRLLPVHESAEAFRATLD